MSTEANKAIVRRFYESYNDKNLDASFELISPNLINHAFGGQSTRESWLEWDKTLIPAFPDLAMHIADQMAEGDKVVTRWIMTGTQQRPFSGIAPSGKKMTLTDISIDRVADGKIVEHWAETNFGQVMQQLSDPS
jgi:steroid delta-isomerase-like uncharacterized protein